MLQGPPGKKGEPGTCTCNATALMASFTMPKMIQGPKGEQGVPGQEGKQGQMGLTVLTLCKKPDFFVIKKKIIMIMIIQ